MSASDSSTTDRLRRRLLSRRQFLDAGARNAAGVAAIGASVVGLTEQSAVADLQRPISVGVVGIRNQGKLLARAFAGLDHVTVTHLCDIDQHLFAPVVKLLEAEQGSSPEIVGDYRALLDRADIDAIVVATPDHWHHRMAVDSLQAGKHLYLETPITHTLAESAELLALQQSSAVTIQTGLSHRSAPHFRSAIECIRQGQIGTVRLAKAWSTHSRRSIGKSVAATVPEGVDYHSWLGPVGSRPFFPNRFHHHWRWCWDFGSGELGNWGVQLLDVARWGLDVQQPLRVTSVGGKLYFDDDQQTPDTQQVLYDFGDRTITWEHRQWSPHTNEGRSAGVAFYGEQGTLIVDRGGWKIYGTKEGPSANGQDATDAHCADFIAAIRSGTTPAAGLHVGAEASTLCHLGNLAHLAGREIRVDEHLAAAHYRSTAS